MSDSLIETKIENLRYSIKTLNTIINILERRFQKYSGH